MNRSTTDPRSNHHTVPTVGGHESCTHLLDSIWAASLGCQPEELRDGGDHVVARPENAAALGGPAPARAHEISLVTTTGKGWVLSVPPEIVPRARSLCRDVSFEQVVREGDPLLQAWYDARLVGEQQERPGRHTYPIADDVAADLSLRGWSHYHLWYADPKAWRGSGSNDRVVLLSPERPDLWRQWEEWSGDFCQPAFARHFRVCEAFGCVAEGRLVSVAQVQAQDHERAWEIGVDTLAGFRGRGYATEAVRATTAWILTRGKVPFYYCDHYNRASAALPRRLGYFRHMEGLFSHHAAM